MPPLANVPAAHGVQPGPTVPALQTHEPLALQVPFPEHVVDARQYEHVG